LELLLDMVYDTAESATAFVGLTPLQVLYGIGALLLVAVVAQIVGALRGRSSFTLQADVRRIADAEVVRGDE